MARLRALPAILLLLSPGLAVYWASDPPEPPLKVLTIRLNPALFWSFSWNQHEWTLVSGRTGLLAEVEMQRRNEPAELDPKGWFTLSRDNQPRYLLQRGDDYLRIYSRNAKGRFDETSTLPVDLKAGATWFDGRVQASCSADSLDTWAGTFRTLRVDFSKDGDILQSLWFAPDEGLVAWRGIDLSPVARRPGSMIEVQVREAAQGYAAYGRIEDHARWALVDCRAPAPLPPRMSVSRDADTHGKKLYYLYARVPRAYQLARDFDQPDGQVIVKESWIPDEPRVKGPLFLMLKSEGDWVFATATSDGRNITASGKLAACIECHESDRTRDRMFGLQSCASAR